MGLTAHCSVIGFFFSFPGLCPSGFSSIAILLPFLINLLFTIYTTFPVCPATEDPVGHSFSSLSLPYTSLIQYSHLCLTVFPLGVKVGKWLLPSQSHSSNMVSVHSNTTALIIHSPEMLWSLCLYPSPESQWYHRLRASQSPVTNLILCRYVL